MQPEWSCPFLNLVPSLTVDSKVLVEYSLAKAGLRGDGGVRFGAVLLSVVRNPIVFMTILGEEGTRRYWSSIQLSNAAFDLSHSRTVLPRL